MKLGKEGICKKGWEDRENSENCASDTSVYSRKRRRERDREKGGKE